MLYPDENPSDRVPRRMLSVGEVFNVAAMLANHAQGDDWATLLKKLMARYSTAADAQKALDAGNAYLHVAAVLAQ